MKKIVVICCVLLLQGLNSFGQTNAVPPSGQSLPRPETQKQRAVSKPEPAEASAVPSGDELSRRTEIQAAQLAMIQRIAREGRLIPGRSKRDFGATLAKIFRSENDQMGETCIRDTVVTIFPAGY